MFRNLLFFAAILGVVLMTACGPSDVQLTADDKGSQVEVKPGDKVIISLAGNPSTGYSWEAQDLDSSIFEQIGEPEFVSDNTDLVGSGGMITLTFKALRTGSTNLTLVYHRPWETDIEPIDTFSVSIAVK